MKRILILGLALASTIGCGDKSKSNDAAPPAEVLNFNLAKGSSEVKVSGAFTKTINFTDRKNQEEVDCAINEKTNSFSFWSTRKENRKIVEKVIVEVPRTTSMDGSNPVKVTSSRVNGQGIASIDFANERGLWSAKDCFAAINIIDERAHFILDCKDVTGRIGQTEKNISLRFQMACDKKRLRR